MKFEKFLTAKNVAVKLNESESWDRFTIMSVAEQLSDVIEEENEIPDEIYEELSTVINVWVL